MRPQSGDDPVSHRMDDQSSSPFAVPALDLDATENPSPQPARVGEPQAAPRSRAARRRWGLWLLLFVTLAGAGYGLFVWRADRGEPPPTARSRSSGPQPVATAPVETADM